MAVYYSCCLAFIMTMLVIVLFRRVAFKIGLVDKPDARKLHKETIPLIGGVAIFLGFVFGLLTTHTSLIDYRGLLIALIIIVLLGVLDDLHELSHRARFVGEVVAVVIAIMWHGKMLRNLGNLLFFHPIHMGFLALPFTIVAVVGIINAVNMTDGSDGLAGTLGIVQSLFMAGLALLAARNNDFVVLILLSSAILGFLVFNFPIVRAVRNKVFMGDVGSMLLGLVLAWFAVSLSQGSHRAAVPITFLWIMAIPLFDIASVVYWRLRNNLSPFTPDRRHLHHLLQQKGRSQLVTLLIVMGLSIILGGIGVAGYLLHFSQGIMFVAFVLFCVGYVFLLNHSKLFGIIVAKPLE